MKQAFLTPAAKTIFLSYAVALALIGVDVVVSRDGLTANDGFSFYGGFARTVIPYSLALLIVAYGMFRIFNVLKVKKEHKKIADVFLFLALCILGLVLTPHTVLNAIHTFFGSMLFAVQLILLIFLAKKDTSIWTAVSALAMFGFGIMALIYLYPEKGYELEAQAGFQISFALGMTHYFKAHKL
jgi:hypothetical protein